MIKLLGSKPLFLLLFLLAAQISFCQKPNKQNYKDGLRSSIAGDFQAGNISFSDAKKEYPNHIQIDLSLNVSTYVLSGEISELSAKQYFKGSNYLIKGKYKKTRRFYINAINEDSTLLEARYNLGLSYLMDNWYAIWQGWDKTELKEIIEIFKRIIDIDKDFYPAQEKVAFLYYLSKNYQTALKHLETALKIKPENTYLYNYIMLCHLYSKNQSKADSLRETYSSFLDLNIIEKKKSSSGDLKVGMSFSEVQKIIPDAFLYSASTLASMSKKDPYVDNAIITKYGELIFRNDQLKSWTYDRSISDADHFNSISNVFRTRFVNGLYYETEFIIDKSVRPVSYVPPIPFSW